MSLTGTLLTAAIGLLHGASASDERQVSLSEVSLVQLDGTKMDASTLDERVVLFVNVASRCGFTNQYEGLQALYEEKKEAGLTVVGVPCNQFGWQEPGSADDIRSFCRMTYGVTFPMLEKQNVNGSERSSLYRWLVNAESSRGRPVLWNFEKFLVGRDGRVITRFPSSVPPESETLRDAIDAALAVPATRSP